MKLDLGLFAVLFIQLLSLSVGAAGPGVTYQGRILKPDGSPLEGASVQFRMQVRSPGAENCLLFDEMQTLSMVGSAGAFALTLNDGTGTRLDTATYPISRIFANRETMTLDSARCSSGTTYTPASTDGRKFIVYFKDETMSTFEPLPILNINYIPQALYALEAQKVGTFAADNILRAVDVGGNPVTAPALNPTQLSTLTTLLAGSGGPSSSSISGAVATNTIDNTNFAQTWNWSTVTTQNPMTMTSNALTTGTLLNLTSSSATFNSSGGLLNVANLGASTNGVLARFQSNSTAGSGLTVLANGNVGMGASSPVAPLHLNRTAPTGTISVAAATTQVTGTGTNFSSVFSVGDSILSYGVSRVISSITSNTSLTVSAPFSATSTLAGATYQRVGAVLNGGAVGIGTTSPTYTLDVNGVIRVGSVAHSNSTGANLLVAKSAEIVSQGGDAILGLSSTNGPFTSSPGNAYFVSNNASNNYISGDAPGDLDILLGGGGNILFSADGWDSHLVIRNSGNVGIGTTSPGASSILDISSTTKGVVLPRMTRTQRDAIVSPVAGMAIYQTDNTPGLRVYNGTNWMKFTETAD